MTFVDCDANATTSLFLSRSSISTEGNKTGSWRFVRPVYQNKTAPCSAACPAGADIGRIEMLVAQGQFRAAWESLLMENPFPAVCGRVCFHPCEEACNRSNFDESIGIHRVERWLGDHAIREKFLFPLKTRNTNGKRIAIAGAGPAGLSAAYFLARLGYDCDVFESSGEPGGILRWGIPAYRLPASVLNQEISRILELGVTLHCDTPVDDAFLAEAGDRYQAIFVGCGHSRSMPLNIPGTELAGDGLNFLYRVRNHEIDSVRGRIGVIGGGNTAIDVARTLIRLGAEVLLIYRRRRQDMPAFSHEVEMAVAEGIELLELAAPIHIESSGERFGVTLQRMKPGEQQLSGRCQVVPDGQKTKTIHVDQVFMAIGAEAEDIWAPPASSQENVLRLSHCTVVQGRSPIIFGGDLTNPVQSVTDAIASGKEAAMAIDLIITESVEDIPGTLESCRVGKGPALSMDAFLMGERRNRSSRLVNYTDLNTDYFQNLEAASPPALSPAQARKSFDEIDGTFSARQAMDEAGRCFNCGICNGCDNCRLFCPELAVTLEDDRTINLDYCKGCGVCVQECPRSAMALEEERS